MILDKADQRYFLAWRVRARLAVLAVLVAVLADLGPTPARRFRAALGMTAAAVLVFSFIWVIGGGGQP